MLRKTLVSLGLVGKLLGCGGEDMDMTPRKTGPADFTECELRARTELREELSDRRKKNPRAYCELFALDFTDRIEACLDELGPYIHVCRDINPNTKEEVQYSGQVDACVRNIELGRSEYAGLDAECVAYHIEEE